MSESEVDLTKEDLDQLKKERSKEFKGAFKLIVRDLVIQASIPHHIDLACGIDNLQLCKEVLQELSGEL